MKCLFDQWFDKEYTSASSFILLLFQAYVAAGSDNREKLIATFPEYFSNVQSLKP